MRAGCQCALLWQILWCTSNQVRFKARQIPGRLNVEANKVAFFVFSAKRLGVCDRPMLTVEGMNYRGNLNGMKEMGGCGTCAQDKHIYFNRDTVITLAIKWFWFKNYVGKRLTFQLVTNNLRPIWFVGWKYFMFAFKIIARWKAVGKASWGWPNCWWKSTEHRPPLCYYTTPLQ